MVAVRVRDDLVGDPFALIVTYANGDTAEVLIDQEDMLELWKRGAKRRWVERFEKEFKPEA